MSATELSAEPTPLASRRRSLVAVALCAFAYLYVFPYQASINNPNENVRLYMTAAIVEEGRYEIDTLRERWGWVNDAAVHEGHVFSVKAPAASFLAVPGYAFYYHVVHRLAGRPFDRTEALWLCRVSAVILPSLLFLYFLQRFFARLGYPPLLRDAVFFSIALGSLLYGYSLLLVSHSLCAAAAFGAFMLLWICREDQRGPGLRTIVLRALLAGLLAASVTLLEYPAVPCSIALCVYAVYVLWPLAGVRALGAFAVGGLVPTLAMMHFQWRAFGSPWRPGHLMVESAAFRAAHQQGLYGAVGPTWPALYGLLIDLGAGLLPLTPVLVLAPIGLYSMLRERGRRAEAGCMLGLVASEVLVIASMNNWRGGWTIGPRYLAVCVPFMGLLSLHALTRFSQLQLRRVAFVSPATLAAVFALGATAAAMLASGVPSAYYPHLPPEFTRPLPQLFALFWAHDFAPWNAGAWLGVYGTASMLPLLACALAALGLCLAPAPSMTRARMVGIAAGAAVCALALSAPLVWPPAASPSVVKAVAFITRHFQPAGHDRAARLSETLRGQAAPDAAELSRLAALYEREGRGYEAGRARRGMP